MRRLNNYLISANLDIKRRGLRAAATCGTAWRNRAASQLLECRSGDDVVQSAFFAISKITCQAGAIEPPPDHQPSDKEPREVSHAAVG